MKKARVYGACVLHLRESSSHLGQVAINKTFFRVACGFMVHGFCLMCSFHVIIIPFLLNLGLRSRELYSLLGSLSVV